MVSRSPNTRGVSQVRGRASQKDETYSTAEALPVIFPTERFHSLLPVPNGVLALLAFRRAKPHMAGLAIRVSFIHCETNVVVLKFAVAFEGDATSGGAVGDLAINAGSQKWVSALGAEEMLFVVCAFSELRVIKCDEALVHNCRFAVIALRGEALESSCEQAAIPGRQQANTHLMIIKMAVGFAVTLIRADVFEKVIAVRAPEAARVPSNAHCTDNTTNNWTATTPARKAATTTSR